MEHLAEKKCIPCEAGVKAFDKAKAVEMLSQLNGWTLNEAGTEISREFKFKNFFRTMSFVNAVAHIANHENHHPDMKVGFNYCHLVFTTHAIDGLSENDFICAAKVDKL
ncbi:MAG: 4a-hydroxytetrahydrobiopterin dehydratase [Pseudomonadota bacterium]